MPLHSFVSLVSLTPRAVLVGEGAASSLSGVLPLVLMFAVVYFIVLRPMSKQEKDRKKRVEGLSKGDEVVIGGGIIGRITNLEDSKIAIVEIAERVRIRVLRKDILDAAAAAMKDPAGTKAEPKPAAKAEAKPEPKADAKAAKKSEKDIDDKDEARA